MLSYFYRYYQIVKVRQYIPGNACMYISLALQIVVIFKKKNLLIYILYIHMFELNELVN